MKTDEQIMADLTKAIEGLWYMSESDHPLEMLRFDVHEEPGMDRLRELAGADAADPIECRTLDEFFRDGAAVRVTDQGAQAASFAAVLQTLKANLTDIKVFRIGKINISVYILGQSPSGHWMGLKTRVVET